MKTILSISKTALLCILLLATSTSFAQLIPTTFTTTQGQCVDLGIDSLLANAGLTLDSFNILSGPFNGQLVSGGLPDSWIYCPDSAFVGTDQALVYICINGPTFPICDTLNLIFVVQPAGGCQAIINASPNLICKGESVVLTASGSGGISPYSYQWSTGDTTASIIDSPDTTTTYTVTVTDANNCTAAFLGIVPVRPNPPTVVIQPGPCAGPLPSLIAVVSSGIGPYQYLWSNGVSSDVVCNLTTGSYCVTINDANGCSASTCQVVGGVCPINVSLALDSSGCITSSLTGGAAPYNYVWSNGSTGSLLCNVDTSLTYHLWVSDSFGCFGNATYFGGTCQLVAGVTDSSGCLRATTQGGIFPYTYLWSNGSTTRDMCPSAPGIYCLTITDVYNCADSVCVNYPLNCAISVTIVLDSSNCLNVVATGGTPSYTYQWSDGSIGSTHCNINPLSAYTVTVTDSSGCSATATYNSSGCQLSSTISRFFQCLEIIATGGTPPYSYQWSNGSTADAICPNTAGTYCVTITDSQGCQDFQCETVGGGCQITVTIVLDSSRCMNVVATGGTPPYTYLWNDGSAASINCNVNPGITYTVTVSDANGCTGTAWYFDPGCQIAASIVYDSLNNCYTVSATGGTPPYVFLWSDNSIGSSVCNVLPGATYCVTATDVNGCSGTACNNQTQGCSLTYTQAPFFPSVVVFVASYDSLLNPANVIWDFGDGNMGTGFQLTHTYTLCNLTYTVIMTLTDSLGNNLCSYTQTVYVPCFQNFCQASFSFFQDSVDNLTFHFKDRSVYNPVSFVWDFGDGTSDTTQNPTHTYTTAGIYNVCLVVTDASGCASTSCQQVNAGNVQIQDLTAYLYHYTTVTPGFPLWASLSYCNYGNSLMNGTVEYRYPAGTTIVSATPPPTSHNAGQRLLTFSFTNLLPGSCGSIAVDLTVDASLPLGSVANDTMWVKPITGDINPLNNISSISVSVIGSWDPNDKAVSPKGLGDDGEIPLNTQTLSYKVRFQNTGTATAQNVVIRDAIDNSIDLSSVRVTDGSHEHMTEIIGNELVVTFNNIMLPDSNANELASHGYIQIIAGLKPGLTEGTQIFNTAEIYFDFNPAVITNMVVNTLKDEGTGIKQPLGLDFSIMPNPAQDEITISGKFSRNSTYEIVNGLGQVAMNGDVVSDKTKIFIGKLNTGVYFLRIKSKDKVGVQRLMVGR